MQNRIKEARNYLKLTVDELSQRTEIPTASIYAYEKGSRKISLEYVHSLYSKCGINPLWILSGEGDIFIDETYVVLNFITPKYLRDTFKRAIQIAHHSDDYDQLEQTVLRYEVMAKIKTKFVNINVEQSFWQWILKGDVEKNTYLYILGKALTSFEKLSLSNKITAQEAKPILLNIVNAYELSLFNEKILRGIKQSDQIALSEWIKSNLTDLECYVILQNIPEVLEILRDEINLLNKRAISVAA